jgi:hypothetical protein
LFRNSVRFNQILIARRGNSGKIGVGLGGVQVGTRLRKLLIDFGRVNIRQQLALWHSGSDIVVPLLEVAVGTGVDRRFHVGLQRTGQHQVFLGDLRRGMYDRYGRYGQRFRVFGQRMILRAALEQSECAQDYQDNRTANQIREKPGAFLGLLASLLVFHL